MYDIDYLTERREVLERIAKCCLREENVIPYLDDIEKEKKIHNIHDKGYKYLFSVKRNFIEFVKTFMKVQLNVELTLFVDWMVNVFSVNKEIKERVEKILINEEENNMWNCARVMNELLNDKVNVGRVDTIKRLVSYKLNINLTPMQIELIDNASLDSLSKIERKIFEINSWEEIEMLINNL